MNTESVLMTVPEQNKVANFDPMKFLHNGKLELRYKKLWFRLKHPNGRIRLYPLKITDQLAIIEARVYLDKEDTEPETSFIATKDITNSPGGLYIESAQHTAADQALSDAGFDIQIVSANPSDKTTAQVASVAKKSVPPIIVHDEKKSETEIKTIPTPTIETVSETISSSTSETATDTESTPMVDSVIEESVEQQPAVTDTVCIIADNELTTADEEAPEEVNEVFGEAEAPTSSKGYTKDMPVETICSMMTYEEAGNVIVPVGTCKGWTLSQVADRRSASLKWYINGYTGDDNILRAAATIMQESLMQQAS